MAPDELLGRLSSTLRHEIGPAVGDTYPRTQAFMASVVLEKLAGQLRRSEAHRAADAADFAALADDLGAAVGEGDPPGLREAVAALAATPGPAAASRLVEALYAGRDALGPARFEQLLGRVRATSRARLDRQLQYAR
jgi:hypothetical protein